MVIFFPKAIPFPEIKLDDFLKKAATDIITLLTTPSSSTTPSLQAGNATRNALLEIAKILHRAEDLPKELTPSTVQIQLTHNTQSPRVTPHDTSSPRLEPSPRVLKSNLTTLSKSTTSIPTCVKHKTPIPPQPPPNLQTNW